MKNFNLLIKNIQLKICNNISINGIREKFLILISILIIINLICNEKIALKQDEYYLKYTDKYLAFKDLRDNNPQLAIKEINYFQTKEKDNYVLFLDKAYIYINEKKYNLAKLEYEKAFKKKPLLLKNVKYLYLYGETLYLNKDYKEAKKYFKKIQKIQQHTKYDKYINIMMQKMN